MSTFSILYNKTKNLIGSVRFYFIITPIFIFLAILCFTWKLWSSFSLDFPIDHAIWGQFGDFIGGTLGTIFSLISVVMIAWTFNIQNRTAVTQRFNDLFFELLDIFQSQEKELQYYHEEDGHKLVLSDNKDFFFELNKKMATNYVPSLSFSQNRKNAITTYTNTTIDYKDKLSICYRTLYQLLNLVENGDLNQKEKVEYLKILRSQLTESELLFLRYHIKTGEYIKFAFLINKSNLMKHLPLFDLLEFKYWREKLQPIEIKYANDFFISLFKTIRKHGKRITSVDKSISASIIQTKTSLKVEITKNAKSAWVNKFNNKEFENLCEGVLKEIVMFSNYSCYNNYKELVFSPAQTNNNVTTVEVHNKKGNVVKVAFDNNMNYEDIKTLF